MNRDPETLYIRDNGRGNYEVKIVYKMKSYYGGSYRTLRDAQDARDKLATEIFGLDVCFECFTLVPAPFLTPLKGVPTCSSCLRPKDQKREISEDDVWCDSTLGAAE